MKSKIIQIGNSKGVRIPKALLEQCNLKDIVEIDVNGNQLLITPEQSPRANWENAFKTMVDLKDDKLHIDDDVHLTVWDDTEWEW